MRVILASVKVESPINGEEILKAIERAGRTAYKSEDRITEDSARRFVKMLISSGHHSVIEHYTLSARFICDRGVTHEMVRHRLASYTQESTRYCNYSQNKFGKEITVINPADFMTDEQLTVWLLAMEAAERHYFALIEIGCKPQMARSVLPNSLKTEIVMTCNLREWRHFFTLRTAPSAHPQMRQVARQLLHAFREFIPVIFDGIADS